jgi:D-alanyl-D-alanine carboxypeptidase
LAKRFTKVNLHGAEVRAKTGYIRDVYTMSGYVTCPEGRRYAFSILINGTRDKRNPKKLQERIVELIAAQGC